MLFLHTSWKTKQKHETADVSTLLLPGTLADQTVLGQQQVYNPAHHGQLLWVTTQCTLHLQPYSRVRFPGPTKGVHRSYSLHNNHTFPSHSLLLGIPFRSPLFKAALIQITTQTRPIKSTKLWPLPCILIRLSTGSRASTWESSVSMNYPPPLLPVHPK